MGGVIAKMITPIRWWSDRHWSPVAVLDHRDDLVNLILQALTRSDIEGVLNATAPILLAWRIHRGLWES